MAARAMRDRMVFIIVEMFIGFEMSGLTFETLNQMDRLVPGVQADWS